MVYGNVQTTGKHLRQKTYHDLKGLIAIPPVFGHADGASRKA